MTASLQILLSRAQNISLFLMFVVGNAVLRRRMASKGGFADSLIEGPVFGIAAILAIAAPFELAEGVIIQSRNAIVAAGTVAGGPVAGLLTLLMAAGYRLHIGVNGVYPALTSMALVYAAAMIFRWKLREAALEPRFLTLLGLFISIGVLPTYFLLPAKQAWPVLRSILLPVVVVTPAGLFLIGSMLKFDRRWSDARSRLPITSRSSRRCAKRSGAGGYAASRCSDPTGSGFQTDSHRSAFASP